MFLFSSTILFCLYVFLYFCIFVSITNHVTIPIGCKIKTEVEKKVEKAYITQYKLDIWDGRAIRIRL